MAYAILLIVGEKCSCKKNGSDANNIETSTTNAQNGLIPSYTITDITASYKLVNGIKIKAGVNNVFDKTYFTRRAGGYPGPGALPADGRTFFVSVGAKL
jgi:Fe(3+) dicitrate transport protein